jgi:hypothetical protein
MTIASDMMLQDPSIKAPASFFISEGIHGLRYLRNSETAFLTSTSGSTFNRYSVDKTTESPTGNVSTVTTSVNASEDLALLGETA